MSNHSVLVLEEELAVHEATLQTLVRRQQEALGRPTSAIATTRTRQHASTSLQARRETLLQARQRHLNLQHEMQQALEKSQERLARVSHRQQHHNKTTIMMEIMRKQPYQTRMNQVISRILEQETDTAPAISIAKFTRADDEIMTKFLETTKLILCRLQVLLPCLHSSDLMQRIMNLTALETLALDQTEPLLLPLENHRHETLCKTCLDLLSILLLASTDEYY